MDDPMATLREALRDRYAVEREVGRGAMAVVLLAYDQKLGRPVAIKVLNPGVLTPTAAERFVREVRITAQLQHPNILSLIDAGEVQGLLYSVMPYIEGETLRQRLLAGPLPVPEALFLAREITEALDYAHGRGIIHRDVKPENILLTGGHAIVADFGIARAVGLAGGNSLTGQGRPIGTAAYMSPELVRGNFRADARSDVYSTGCVLYEMLTGRMAFGGGNLREVLERQTAGSPTPVNELRPEVPPAVVDIVERSLAKAPEKRYQTAGAMAADLRVAAGDTVSMLTPSADSPLRWQAAAGQGVAGQRAWGAWLMAAAGVALLALLVTRFWPARQRMDPPSAAAAVRGSQWLEWRTPEALRRAVDAFDQALRLDSGSAQALAGLASANTYTVIYGYPDETDPYDRLARALQLAGRAVVRDSSLAAAWLARADARSIAFAPEDSVRADLLRARRLMPSSADARMAYAWSLFRSGAMDSAFAVARGALALDPLAPGLRHSFVALAIGARRYDVALREVRAVASPRTNDPVTAILEGYAQLLSGRTAECATRDNSPWLALRAMCLFSAGRGREAAALSDSAAGELQQEHYGLLHQYADLAAYYAWRGDAAKSVEWLERSVTHSPMLHRWQIQSGLYDRVRSQPAFQQGMARLRAQASARLRARRAAIGD